MKPLHYYYMAVASWFLGYGIQVVGFAWIVTMVLNESATMVGIAQMTFLLPAMMLMLVGGSLADQYGGRRVALIGHIVASLAPLFLITATLSGNLNYGMLLVYAVIMGSAQALITPARDGLLAKVAEGEIQKRVVQASVIQFGVQMFGFAMAGAAEHFGVVILLATQFCFFMAGAVFYALLKLPEHRDQQNSGIRGIFESIAQGFQTVRASPALTAIVIQNCGMGIFFMGTYIVSVPLLIREFHQGTSAEISWINMANSLGLVTTTMILMRFGDIKRQGRALLIAQGIGCFVLAGSALPYSLGAMIAFIYAWGLGGGIAMSMSRTIMQELSPPDQRSRMMAFYAFAFMGSGPVGALLCGLLADRFGPAIAIYLCAAAMLVMVTTVSIKSPLWRLGSQAEQQSSTL